jgi:formamidopyrimidine-DNA glycosylase
MPELPEVETIARRLRDGGPESPSITGRTITSVVLLWERTLAAPSPPVFLARLSGQMIQNVTRRGKFLILNLTKDALLFHLRMSGDMAVRPASSPPAFHDRLILHLSGDVYLAFNDTRKFGRAWLASDPTTVIQRLGPEPLSPDFTPEELFRRLQRSKRQLKPLLLDQAFIAGLGNIYSDEALHMAKLHPRTLSHTLSESQAERLWESIRHVLKEGIRLQGASIDWVYRGGDFQKVFRVYRRTGMDCPTCGAAIQRLVVGQRSTHICPVCQPGPHQEGTG